MLKMKALKLDTSSSMCLVAFTMEMHHGSVRASILYKSRTSLGRFLLSAARLIIFFMWEPPGLQGGQDRLGHSQI